MNADARHRHTSAHRFARYPALSVGPAWRHAIDLVERAADHLSNPAQGHGRCRRRQGGDRAFLHRLWLRQQLCGRRGRCRSVPLHRGLFHRRHGARRGEDIRCLARPRLQRHAPVHHRIDAAGSGHLVRRPEDLSILGACVGQEHSGLHADEAGRLAAAAQDHGSLSEGHDDARPFGACAVRGRAALSGRRRIPRSRQIPAGLSEDHARQCDAQELGPRHAGNVFRQDRRYVRRVADCLGLEFSEFARHAAGNPGRRARGVFLRQGVGSGLDFRQDRAHALSRRT